MGFTAPERHLARSNTRGAGKVCRGSATERPRMPRPQQRIGGRPGVPTSAPLPRDTLPVTGDSDHKSPRHSIHIATCCIMATHQAASNWHSKVQKQVASRRPRERAACAWRSPLQPSSSVAAAQRDVVVLAQVLRACAWCMAAARQEGRAEHVHACSVHGSSTSGRQPGHARARAWHMGAAIHDQAGHAYAAWMAAACQGPACSSPMHANHACGHGLAGALAHSRCNTLDLQQPSALISPTRPAVAMLAPRRNRFLSGGGPSPRVLPSVNLAPAVPS